MGRGFKHPKNKIFYDHLKFKGYHDIAYPLVKITDIDNHWVAPSNVEHHYMLVDKEYGLLEDGVFLNRLIRITVFYAEKNIDRGYYTKEEAKAIDRYLKILRRYL